MYSKTYVGKHNENTAQISLQYKFQSKTLTGSHLYRGFLGNLADRLRQAHAQVFSPSWGLVVHLLILALVYIGCIYYCFVG